MTEIVVFGPKEKIIKVSVYLESIMLKSSNQVGVIMDSGLNFNNHIKTITKSFNNGICLKRIQKNLLKRLFLAD